MSRVLICMTAAALFTCLPSMYFFHFARRTLRSRNQQARDAVRTTTLIKTYLLTATLGCVASVLIQMALTYPLALICTGSHETAVTYYNDRYQPRSPPKDDHQRTAVANEISLDPKMWLFEALHAFLLAGVVDEAVKHSAFARARPRSQYVYNGGQRDRQKQWSQDHLLVAAATGLGFATFENMVFFLGAALAPSTETSAFNFAVLVVFRTIIGEAFHTMLVVLSCINHLFIDLNGESAMGLACSWWQVLGKSAMLHGIWNFGAIAGDVLYYVDWFRYGPYIGSLMCLCAGSGTLIVLARLVWTRLKQYEQEVGM
ncbi:hypothetical protein H2200_007946 [Cladophialophora chaetospira]|uniref:Uncharacterized protein n=1 Tax=Cladophialophora chaetospira TaxID=386627 RepID=A0AA38X6Q6_9EURO|nr:hypothetical protein H2200_007946 [Cladophialophora chaetospira]